jgi:hypothetical protein
MTKEEIIKMAEQAGFMFDRGSPIGFTYSMLKDFAKLVAEHEREECAKVADEYAEGAERNYSEIIADNIRARIEK